ncbi:MAG: TssQ family T6SS-associated lipoprotein [Aquabacterium sp.]
MAAKGAAPAATPPVPAKPAPRTPAAGEAALADGLKAYKAGQYKQSEAQLKAALKAGLDAPADLANAHKHLAFIYCTSKRTTLCAAAFKNAKAADPTFALSKAEAGHPMWGRTYRKALGL